MSTIFDYLGEEEAHSLYKLAGLEKKEEEEEHIPLNRATAHAGLKALGVIAVGGGLGYLGGKMLGPALEKGFTYFTGKPLTLNHLESAGALLGGTLMAAEAYQDKKVKEVLRRAYKDSQDRSAGRVR